MSTPKDMTKELPEFKPSRLKDWILAKVQNLRKVVIPIFLKNPKKQKTIAKAPFAKYNPPDPIPAFKPRPKPESVPTSALQLSEPKPASAQPETPSSQPSQPEVEIRLPLEVVTHSSGLCGIWKDHRDASEIVAEIISSRTLGRDLTL